MRMSKLVGKTLKETPKDAQSVSHAYLIRGGYVRPVSAGIYSLLPLAHRIVMKIENVIREEMNAIEGQEVLMPVVLPRELWDESGRYHSVGSELLRFKDRNGRDMLLGMTHEEAVVHLARNEIHSYKQLPFMLYQIQTKYRDEARPRAGLIRVREFTMKDAYSFHSSNECLAAYYKRAHEAYVRIFQRLGFKDVVSIESDTGMMGGAVSHEFMAIAECGEDTIFSCKACGYRANKEIAKTGLKFTQEAAKPLDKVGTPGQKTIEDLAKFLGISASQTGKAVFFEGDNGKLYLVVIRGDLEVNETKLRNALKVREFKYATDERIRAIGSVPGYASPLNMDASSVEVIFDRSVAESSNLVVGANEVDFHYLGFNFERDTQAIRSKIQIQDLAMAREGDPCPNCSEPLAMNRGIEIGNIFQLGTKYSESMGCCFLDQDGKSRPAIMGCYGIGVGRSMAAVIEQSHDKNGPIWPSAIAPYQVHLCALNMKEAAVQEASEKIYAELLQQGVDVLFDDRNEKAGVCFSDADLIGIPVRMIVSPKTIARNEVELKGRAGDWTEMCPLAEVGERVRKVLINAD